MNTPLLTIAIPTYNGAKTIDTMLRRLLPQVTSQVEIMVSDNCSDDDTPLIINNYMKKYKINYIRNETNIGPDANFLQCMVKANGDFVWLISDDDVITEGALSHILEFLSKNKECGLVYLTTGDFRGKYKSINDCAYHRPILSRSYSTLDKKEFIKYAGAYWGFISSFICKVALVKEIEEPEQYFKTFWLQSYIHALCAKGNMKMGLISYPCVAAGIYMNVANYDSAEVNGVYYKKMIDFMVINAGFPKKALEKLYINRLCHLARHDIIKEKAIGKMKLNIQTLFMCTKTYPLAWVSLYPFLFIPKGICRITMTICRKSKGIKEKIRVNRVEDMSNYI